MLSKINQLTFSSGPLFFPVPCNHSLTGFKMGRTNATYLQRMLWVPPLNVVHWGHQYQTPGYTEVTLWWRGCVKPGHHVMSLDRVGSMYRIFLGNNSGAKRKHNICAAPNCHLDGECYCDSASPPYTLWNSYPVWFADPSVFVNLAILIMLVAIPWEKPDSCCWIYPKKSFDDGNHLPIFLILSSSNPASFIAHAPPAQFQWVSILCSGIFLLG